MIKKYKRRKKDLQNQPQTIKKISIGTYIPLNTLNVNGLSVLTKRHRLAEWIQKTRPINLLSERNTLRPEDTCRLKIRVWENIFHANVKQKKAGVEILISDKIDVKKKKITRDKEGHYILIK